MAIRIATMTLIALFLSVATAGTAWAQDSVGDPVPLLNGTDKAKLLYSIPYAQSNADIATCVACTDVGKGAGSVGELFAVEFYQNGIGQNDLTLGEGVESINAGGDSDTICTRSAASVDNETTAGIAAEDISHGVARIVATTTKLVCTAFMVPVVGDPPGFMTILPLYKGTKQKGGM